MVIPDLRERLQAFVYKREFATKLQDIQGDIEIVDSAMNEVKESIKFKKILEVQLFHCCYFLTLCQYVLTLGNHMNAAYLGGQTKGYKISSIMQLNEIKSNDNTFSLLEYLINLLTNSPNVDVLSFEEELPNLKNGSKGNFQQQLDTDS
jgi:hypothetical protein